MSIDNLYTEKFIYISGGCDCCCSDSNNSDVVGTYVGDAGGWGDCQYNCLRLDFGYIVRCAKNYSDPCM